MSPPNWGTQPTYACPQCGSLSPRHRYELSTLRNLNWQVATVISIVAGAAMGPSTRSCRSSTAGRA